MESSPQLCKARTLSFLKIQLKDGLIRDTFPEFLT